MANIASSIPLNPGFVTGWNKIPEGANTTSTTKVKLFSLYDYIFIIIITIK